MGIHNLDSFSWRETIGKPAFSTVYVEGILAPKKSPEPRNPTPFFGGKMFISSGGSASRLAMGFRRNPGITQQKPLGSTRSAKQKHGKRSKVEGLFFIWRRCLLGREHRKVCLNLNVYQSQICKFNFCCSKKHVYVLLTLQQFVCNTLCTTCPQVPHYHFQS